MNFHEISIYFFSPPTCSFSDFKIISIDNDKKELFYKLVHDNKNVYFSYYIKNNIDLYLFLEIMHKFILWETTWTISNVNSQYCLQLIINPQKELLSQFFNKSLALNLIMSSKFNKLEHINNIDMITCNFIPYINPIEPPSFFKINLYEYQKKSLAKMLEIEKNVYNPKIKYTVPIKLCDNEYIYDPISNKKTDHDKYLEIDIKGGILADQMGLGKTVTSIALINLNPALLNINTKFSTNYKSDKFFSKATLILCPSHISKQWENESIKCNPNSKILLILNKKDMAKIRIPDIQNADIIITSHQFLMNFKYYPTLHYREFTPSGYLPHERRNVLKNKLSILLKDDEYMNNLQAPIFEFFYFHRVILDEGHEIFNGTLENHSLSNYMTEWLTNIDSDHYWYLSGTPFINLRGIKNCCKFINLNLNKKNLSFDYSNNSMSTNKIFTFLEKEYIWLNILNKICIRHRKIDVENQIYIPGYEEQLIWIKFTDFEKQLYNSKKNIVSSFYLQQLCCHPLVINSNKKIFDNLEVDLSVMQDKLLEHYKQTYENNKLKLEKLNKNNQEYHMLKNTYEYTINEANYMITILDKMKNNIIDEEDNNCSICLDIIKNPSLTSCGHLFCYECLKTCLSIKKNCPICKTNLQGKEIMLLNKNKTTNTGESLVNPLIEKYGSKLGKTISLIRGLVILPETRIIIFSQWDDMLTLIGKTLAHNGIENSFIKGNVNMKNNAIKKFKIGMNNNGQDNKVIMLSLKNAASGTNLTEATHIFFIEPINAQSDECNAIESQAIGRACRIGQKNKIKVIRILIQDSIEETIYKTNYNSNVIIPSDI
jgi:DNA repair protein RAD5